jgi:hypothetical protein
VLCRALELREGGAKPCTRSVESTLRGVGLRCCRNFVPNFRERRKGEVQERRILLLRTRVNRPFRWGPAIPYITDWDYRLCAQPFVIFAHPSVLRELREGAFEHPPVGQHSEASRWHELPPVHHLTLFSAYFGSRLRRFLRSRLRGSPDDLHCETRGLLCPPPSPAFVSGVQPEAL